MSASSDFCLSGSSSALGLCFSTFFSPTMGIFLWQLVTVQQFLLVCMQIHRFTGDVAQPALQSAASIEPNKQVFPASPHWRHRHERAFLHVALSVFFSPLEAQQSSGAPSFTNQHHLYSEHSEAKMQQLTGKSSATKAPICTTGRRFITANMQAGVMLQLFAHPIEIIQRKQKNETKQVTGGEEWGGCW